MIYHTLPVFTLLHLYFRPYPYHKCSSCNKDQLSKTRLLLCGQVEDFLDSANRGGITGVLTNVLAYEWTQFSCKYLHEVVADLHAGCAIHGSDLNNHVQRLALIFSTTRIRAEVVRKKCPDTE